MSILLLVSSAVASATQAAPASSEPELGALLASADAIDRVEAGVDFVVFTIERDGEAYRVSASTPRALVTAVADLGPAPTSHEGDRFGWISHALGHAPITALEVSGRTAIIATAAGERLALLPGTDGNTAVEARWAAAWDAPDAHE